jgi:hypothetical protein
MREIVMTDTTAQGTMNTSTTGAPANFPLSEIPHSAGIISALLTLVGGMMWLRRRISRDSVEGVKDRSEKSLVQTLQHERDSAVNSEKEAWKTRTDDAKRIGELTSEVKHLTRTNVALMEDVTMLRVEVKALRDMLHSLLPKNIADMIRAHEEQLTIERLREIVPPPAPPPHEV